MRTARSRMAVLRFVCALVFGAMSAVHMPTMAFAKTASHTTDTAAAAAHHDMIGHHHGDAQRPTDRDDRGASQAHDDAAVCHSSACCAVTLSAVPEPVSAFLLLGQLRVAPARAIVPVSPEPLVPPPRPQD